MSRRNRQKSNPNRDRSVENSVAQPHQDSPEAEQDAKDSPTRLLLLLWGIPLVVVIAAIVVRLLR